MYFSSGEVEKLNGYSIRIRRYKHEKA